MSQTVLITGASSGIGRSTAKRFQNEGWNVVATMRSPNKEIDLSELDHLLVAELDVTDSTSIQEAVALGKKHFGRIDALVNNAGYGAYGPLEAFDKEGIKRQFDTNVLGMLDVTQAVLPGLREQGSGTIVNISSIGGQIAFPLGSLYHGTKFAVEGLSEALYYELFNLGIRVKIVQPGLVATDFGGRSFDFREGSIPAYQRVIKGMGSGFGKIGSKWGVSRPEDVANVIFQAVLDKSDTLRYTAGTDASALLKERKISDDGEFLKGIRKRFDI